MHAIASLLNHAFEILFITVVLWAIVIYVFDYFSPKTDAPNDFSDTSVDNQQTLKNVPQVLIGATLFLNESPIAITSPLKLHGKVDQVFKTSSGKLIPVDTKQRSKSRWYESDKLQLSVYAMILRHLGHDVSWTGYIRIPNDGNPIYLPIPLGDDAYVSRAVTLYQAIKSGEIIPNCTCKKCTSN